MIIFDGVTHFSNHRALLDLRRVFKDVWQVNPLYIKSKNILEVAFRSDARWRAECQEKLLKLVLSYPYRKPTQVNRASSLRGTGEPSLRNSAKNLDVSSRDVFPDANRGAAKETLATVYQKHRSLQTRKGKYRG